MKMIQTILALLIGLECHAVSGDKAVSCHKSYTEWLTKYGASDPFQALNRTTPWQLDPTVLEQVVSTPDQVHLELLPPAELYSASGKKAS
jgi:hypothetical protein